MINFLSFIKNHSNGGVNSAAAFTHLVLAKETLAEDKVSVWEIGESLDEDLARHGALVGAGIELVQLEECQVGLQIISVLPGLQLHIPLKCGDVLWVVPGRGVAGVKKKPKSSRSLN